MTVRYVKFSIEYTCTLEMHEKLRKQTIT